MRRLAASQNFSQRSVACGARARRERLAQSGMLTKQQRLTAVPTLLKYGEDPSLDSNTRDWVYQALRNITGARYGTNAGEWREWRVENENAPR